MSQYGSSVPFTVTHVGTNNLRGKFSEFFVFFAVVHPVACFSSVLSVISC